MKFLKNNMWTIAAMVFLFTVVMIGDASATNETVFSVAKTKLANLFKNSKRVVFVIGGFGLVALAFQAIFGKVKWPWFAALAFGLAVLAVAGSIINYATEDNYGATSDNLEDTLKEIR